MRRLFISLLTLLLFPDGSSAQKELLNAGPMVGCSEMREVKLWVQTSQEAEIRITYRDSEKPDEVFSTASVRTKPETAFTAKLTATPLEPGRVYEYDLLINNEKIELDYPTTFQSMPIWKWRSDPPDLRFAAGSCAYINEEKYDRPGKPYGSDYQIFQSIYRQDPDFMIWLGDNIYFREPDWNSRTGILYRYTHDRAVPELQPLLGSVHHYAIWDDHDYGPDNGDRSFWNKSQTFEAFELFWANPSFGIDDLRGAITFFQWNDVDFILLDNRFYRTPNHLEDSSKTMLGPKQKQWLKDRLLNSLATFKVVVMGGQFLNTEAKNETYSNYGFDKERQEIIDFILSNDIHGVVFLTGDRHYTELSKLEVTGKPVIYDLTVSSLTAGIFPYARNVNNELRVEGTVVDRHNFGLIDVTGPLTERKFTIRVFDADGALQWVYVILND